MPRIVKALPVARADYSFGDLLYWHLFVHGTRPTGDPAAAIGREWEAGGFCALIGITDRTLRNWIRDRNFPDSTALIAQELFGDNPALDAWRVELAEALRETRQRKLRKPAENSAADAAETEQDASPGRNDASSGGTRRATDDDASATGAPARAVIPYAGDRARDAGAARRAVITPLWTRSTGGHRAPPPRRTATAIVSGLVILIGLYASIRPPPEKPFSQPSSSNAPPASAPPEPKPEVMRKPADDTITAQEAPAPAPPRVPAPDTTPEIAVPKPEPPKAETLEPELPQAERPPASEAPPAPRAPNLEWPRLTPPPLLIDPKQAAAAARAAEEARIVRETTAARQRAFDAAQRALEEEARRHDQDADDKTAIQRERDTAARQLAGMGYRLMENTSAVSGASLGPILAETVTECAEACRRDNCDGFTFSGAPGSRTAAYCYRYKAPVGFRAEPSFRAGKRMADAPDRQIFAEAESLPVAANPAPTFMAQANPTPPATDPPDDLTRCANGAFKVSGFKLSCDRIMDGGTSLGSAPLRYVVANINQCAAKCRPLPRCVGFTYNAADPDGQHTCQIFGPVPITRGVGGYVSGTR